jgi:hypothetical protein
MKVHEMEQEKARQQQKTELDALNKDQLMREKAELVV